MKIASGSLSVAPDANVVPAIVLIVADTLVPIVYAAVVSKR
jgi:hypothetical protein